MPYVPQEVIKCLEEDPSLTGMDLFLKGLAGSPRTANRYKQYVVMKKAVPDPHREIAVSVASQQEQNEEEFDVEEFLKIAPTLVREAQRNDPVLTHDTFNFNADSAVGIIFPSCAHLGGRYTAYDEFRIIFNKILDTPRIFWASLGDDIEGFISQFRDADAVQSQIFNIKMQYQLLSAVLDKLVDKNKLLLGVASQHGGAWTQKQSGENPIKDLYRSHNVPFYDGKAYLRFEVGNQVYHVAIAHEFPGNSIWNAVHPQTRALRFDFPNADVVVCGDKHKWGASVIPAFPWESEAGNRSSSTALLIQSGTAKTGPDKWSIAGWSKGQLGWPICIFYPHKHEIQYTFDFDIAEYLLARDPK